MKKILSFLFLLALLAAVPLPSDAAVYRVVMDPYALAAVTANTAAVKAVEDAHNKELDTIKTKQQKIMKYTATMESIKELYKMTMQNVNGFGEESRYYQVLARELAQIPYNVGRATSAIAKCPYINYINCLDEIVNIQMETVEVVKMFVDVVNNGKVSLQNSYTNGTSQFSELMKKAQIGKGDGYNFLDRYRRLDLCNKLISTANDINVRLQNIVYVCEYCRSLSNVLYNLDPDTWINIMTGKYIVDGIISDWNWEMGGV